MQDTRQRDLTSSEIRANLARQQKTQRELAVILGISQPQVSARLRGDVAWNVDELATIAKWLGVPLTSLIVSAA